ncbi:MAG TPA: hypothetical protein VFO40_08415, partial [Chthoniobacterales bacterium]|nr:hypothetical protein [Chthoniobacterales bacterium]
EFGRQIDTMTFALGKATGNDPHVFPSSTVATAFSGWVDPVASGERSVSNQRSGFGWTVAVTIRLFAFRNPHSAFPTYRKRSARLSQQHGGDCILGLG